MKLLVLNGPNLNLLGTREPGIYGSQTFEDYFKELKLKFSDLTLSYQQSNHEGELVTALQQADGVYDGVVLNAAAYTHTSVAIGDVIKAVGVPVVEVHISNTFAREAFRHNSYISPNAKGVILGFGLQSYDLAIQSFVK
ncbi:type II 3-dehydroquinate dehydratase [Aquimarina agarivorans]|uniref:type II 3-dehydroquinate dehydratase n=1 Tax=Aquimarina agarivorans TaxID=980584 RepID=UPI000248EC2C|nr:type II 3-dehydroquinate dehydratase [Aquimarina agarivorans]